MAKYSSTVHYNITTSLDASGITKLQAELNRLEQEFTTLNKRDLFTNRQTQEALSDIQRIRAALQTAFNPKLGMMNTKTLLTELTAGGRSLSQIYKSLGTSGTGAMTQLYGQLGKIDTGMKSVSKTTDKLLNTLGNTVRWGIVASGFQYVLNSAHSAVNYMKDLDESLTNIRLVTDESKESMREFALYANKAAQSLGNTTVAYTDAALVYAQQGYNLSDQKTLADVTLMTANVTGQDTSEVSEQMTAIMNGFQLSVDEVKGVMDQLAVVANVSAADLEELATAASKVASTANTLGVSTEQLTAQIATIVSVTKEAPENVGNALKTIYARLGDLQMGETLDDGTTLGNLSGQLEDIGIQVMDAQGGMRGMGDILADLMEMWDQLDVGTKQALAVKLAGKYQYNRLMALMENEEKYSEYLTSAETGEGTLDEMQSEYMESLEGKTNALVASLEGAMSTLFDQDSLGPVIDSLTELVGLFTELTEAIGGGGAALTAFGAIGTRIFSNNIGRGISNVISNRQKSQQAKANVENAAAMAKSGILVQGASGASPMFQNMATDMSSVNRFAGSMNQEQIDQVNKKHAEYAEAVLKADAAQKQYDSTLEGARIALAALDIGTEEYRNDVISMLQTLEAGDTKLDGLKESLSSLKDQFNNAQTEVVNFANSIEKVDANSNIEWTAIQKNAQRVSDTLVELRQTLVSVGASTEDIDKLQTTLFELGQTVNGNQGDFQQLERVLESCSAVINKFRSNTDAASAAEQILAQDAIRTRNALSEQKVVVDNISKSYSGLTQTLSTQSMASHVANLTSAAMSLMFAFQSFQALGSIWANEDLTLGEKVGQTLMNGTMAVSMLAMAYNEGAMALTAFKEAQTAETVVQGLRVALRKKEIEATVEAQLAEMGLAESKEKETKETAKQVVAEKALEEAREEENEEKVKDKLLEEAVTKAKAKEITVTELLGKSLDGLTKGFDKLIKGISGVISKAPGLAGAAGILAAALTMYGAYRQNLQESLERNQEKLEESNALIDSIQSQTDNLNSLYSEYKSTGNASEEFKGVLRSLGTELGIVNTELLINTGNYEALKQKIDEATISQLEYNAAAANTVAYQTFQTADSYFGMQYHGEKQYAEAAATNASEQQRLQNDIDILTEKQRLVRLDTTISEERRQREIDQLQNQIDSTQESLDQLRADASEEGFDVWRTNKQQALGNQFTADLASGDLDSYENLNATNLISSLDTRYDSYLDAFSNEERQAKVLEMASSFAESYEDAALSADLIRKSAEQTFDAFAKDSGYDENAEGLLSQISTWMSDEDKISLLNMLQSSELTGKELTDYINEIIARINNGEDIDDILLSIEADQESEETSEEISSYSATETTSILEKGDVSRESLDASKQAIADTAGLTEYQKTLRATIKTEEQQIDALERQMDGMDDSIPYYTELSEQLKESKENLEKNQKALETQEQQLEDVAVAAVQTANGIQELTDSFEENKAIIEQSMQTGDRTSVQYQEAMSATKTSLSQVFNVSQDAFSDSFVEDHLAQIQRIVDGDLSAIDEIRSALAQDLVGKINFEGAEEAKEAVLSDIAELQSLLPDLEVGAYVDTTEYFDALNEMLRAGTITQQQANDILNGIGYDANITTEEIYYPDIKYSVQPVQATVGNSITGAIVNAAASLVPSISFKKATFPVINGVSKKSSSGGYTPKSSSGGGGGGGGSSYEAKTEDYLEDEPDRYQDVNAHLDRLSKNLEKIADEEDRLTGKALLDNMEQQVDLIKQQADQYQRKLEIQQQEAAQLRQELSQDYGITFDSDGFMENYAAVHQQLLDDYNALVDQFNNTSTEEGQEKIKEQMDAAKERLDAFNEGWQRYDELMNNEIPDSAKELENLADLIEDLRIKMFTLSVEAADNIKEIKDAWADYVGFMSGLDPDSPFRALIEDAQRYENAIDNVTAKTEDLENLLQWLPQYEEGGVITEDNPFGENSEAFYEALKTAYQDYISAVIEAEQLYFDQLDDVMEGYDDIADRIGKRMESYSQLTDQLDHYASVIETLYGEEDYDQLLALKRANQDVLESAIEQSRMNLSMWQNELAKYNKETQPELWEAVHEKVVEAQEDLNGLVEEAAQNTAEILEMAVDKTVKEWKDAMMGGDAEWAETQWELSKELADQYLDTVESTYEIEKLRSKYNSLANDTASLRIRQQINEQMETELAYLLEKDKLSQYDVDYANAKLEILQKQIALEDARANKNQMKLRRDSQGNYSYVYAADSDSVAQAESDLLDAEFNAYSISKENYTQTYDNYVSAVSNAAEQIRAIWANTLLTAEEKESRTQEIYKWLSEYITGIEDQIGVSTQGIIESVSWLARDSSEITGETFANIAVMMEEDWIGALKTIGVATSEEFEYVIGHMDEFLDDTQEKWKEFEEATQEWADNVKDISDEGTEGFTNVDNVIIDINQDMKDLNDSTEKFFALINDDLGTIDGAVAKLAEYEEQISGLKDTTSKIYAELERTKAALEKTENELRDYKDGTQNSTDDDSSNTQDGGSSTSGGGSTSGGNGTVEYGDLVTTKTSYASYAGGSYVPNPIYKPGSQLYVQKIDGKVVYGVNGSKWVHLGTKKEYAKGVNDVGWIKTTDITGYDTGGYTGAWGKDGRLAMLHQKELVLNSTDTENILAAVAAIREVVAAMKSDSFSSMLSMGQTSNIATNTGNNIEQNISIYADFPAAESAAEIKAALEGLAQQAVQYSNRKK